MTKETEPLSPRPAPAPAPPLASEAQPKKNRIFIVNDHAMFREGLHQLIEREPDFVVCGDAATAAEALARIPGLNADLVIVDISLADTNGLELVKAIREQCEDLPVLVVSMHDETLYAERALRAGAMGYVMKQEPGKTVKAAIRKVLNGNIHLSETMSTAILAKFTRGHPPAAAPTPVETLSEREMEVFRMLGQGMGIRQIAEELRLGIPTINSFRNRIKEKLNLKSSTEVLVQAIQWFQKDSSTGP